MAAAEEEAAECAYCLEQGDSLVDPRILPCNHICCYPCLVGDFDTNRIVRCGKCREVFDVTLARLPSATTEVNNSQLCDVCVVKGTTAEPAVSYCSTCSRKMCTEHDQFHQDFHPEHSDVMNIEEYKQNKRKLEVRYCIKHEDVPITMACTTCYDLLCTSCNDSSHECANGSPQRAVSLDQIVKVLKSKLVEVKVETQAKEEKLSGLLKHCTRVLSDYEMNTDEMIQLLHNTRDEQLAEVRSKYDKLEKELSESRRRTRDDILQFMEREIGVRLTEINTLLVLQDVWFRDAHQVDVVSSFAEATDELKRCIDERLPSFSLTNSKKLRTQGTFRDIELKMVEDTNMPTALRLMNEVKLTDSCYSVSSHQGVTYVGLNGTVFRIDESDYSLTSLISSLHYSEGIAVYRGRLYVLTDQQSPYKVHVYDLNGTLITSWKHSDSCNKTNKLTITADKVVVPDRSNKQLTVYSLEGQLIKQIRCPSYGEWKEVAICTADNESVVVSSANTSTVFRVNIDTGEVMWTCTDVTKPGGVTCYGEGYILVTSDETTHTEISILDTTTGKYLGKLMDPKERSNSSIYDLCMTGNTLIVPRFRGEKTVLYYELVDG